MKGQMLNIVSDSDGLTKLSQDFRRSGIGIQWLDTNRFWSDNKHIILLAERLLKAEGIKYTKE